MADGDIAQIKPGDTFGRWTVLRVGESRPDWQRSWLCRCSCERQAEKEVPERVLLRGSSQSCGCLASEMTAARNRTHGMAHTPEYTAWNQMVFRCTNPKATKYECYGGRGITVCDRWRYGEGGKSGFECFFEDMGAKPTPAHSIERANNERGYEPSNCRWATRQEQMRNRRNVWMITVNGVSKPAVQWAEEMGKSPSLVRGRLRDGWTGLQALDLEPPPETHRGRPPGPSRTLTHDGRTMKIGEWAKHLGIRPTVIYKRLGKGCSAAEALGFSDKPQRGHPITCNGETLPISEWAKRTGIPLATLVLRLQRGWPVEKALKPKERA